MNSFRPLGFNILPPIIKNLIIANVLVFIAQNIFVEPKFPIDLNSIFALHSLRDINFKWWQVLTHMFMHGSFSHLFFNMFTLWMFGNIIENIWGNYRFIFYYFMCGLCSAIIHLIYLYFNNDYSATLGASGAIAGIIAAFIYYFPNSHIYIYFFMPIKAKWLGFIYFGYELFLGVLNSLNIVYDNIAHWAHLGGAVCGLFLVIYWKKNNIRNNFN